MIIIGMVFMGMSIKAGTGLKGGFPEEIQKKWQTAIYLMMVFLGGYLILTAVILTGIKLPFDVSNGGVFLVGAIFVFYVINLIKITSDAIREADRSQYSEEISKKNADLERKIVELKEAEEQMLHQAMHDELTGLPNRKLVTDRLEYSINIAKRERKPIAVMMLNLDRFREINDTLGHELGDQVLTETVKRLKGIVRESDTVARLSADEFAILMPTIDEKHVTLAAYKILGVFDRPYEIEGTTLDVRAGLGITLYPVHGADAVTLLQRADIAMSFAKKSKTNFSIYSTELDKNSIEQLALIGELRAAIEHDQLVLYYQPKIDIKTGRVKSVEALVRWIHPTRGFMPPDAFIGLAEQTGLIRPLTMWVLRTAISQAATWMHAANPLKIGVNLSARNLQDKHLPRMVNELLEEFSLPPDRMILEITESAIMDDQARALEITTALHEMGIVLSIDDFGTGYSSLAYLKRLPVSELKIDKSFVMEMAIDENDATIVRSTVDLAHNLGLTVVAEGVENQEAWDLLAKLGCDIGQGYYMSRPQPIADLEKWLVESPWGLQSTKK